MNHLNISSGLNLSLKKSNLKRGGRWIRHYMNCHKHTKKSWSGRILLCFSHSCHMFSEDVYSTKVVWTTLMIRSWGFHVSFQAWKALGPIHRDCMKNSLFTVNSFSFVSCSGNIYTLETRNVIHVVTSKITEFIQVIYYKILLIQPHFVRLNQQKLFYGLYKVEITPMGNNMYIQCIKNYLGLIGALLCYIFSNMTGKVGTSGLPSLDKTSLDLATVRYIILMGGLFIHL